MPPLISYYPGPGTSLVFCDSPGRSEVPILCKLQLEIKKEH